MVAVEQTLNYRRELLPGDALIIHHSPRLNCKVWRVGSGAVDRITRSVAASSPHELLTTTAPWALGVTARRMSGLVSVIERNSPRNIVGGSNFPGN